MTLFYRISNELPDNIQITSKMYYFWLIKNKLISISLTENQHF